MNNYILVGKIVNTHGIKGEIRILSSFDRKDLAFKVGNSLYIGDNKIEEKINTYRVHKEFDMVSFERYSNINEVLKYLKQNVYIKREDLKLNDNEYILEDLINMDIIDNIRGIKSLFQNLRFIFEGINDGSIINDILIEDNNNKGYPFNYEKFYNKIIFDSVKY